MRYKKKRTLSGLDMIMPGKKHEKFRAVIAQKTRTCYSGVGRFDKYLQIFTEGGISNGSGKYGDRYYSAHNSKLRI